MIVPVNGVEIDADSRTTATVNRSGLRLTPWKQDSFQRQLHEVSSRQQFHIRRASKHRVLIAVQTLADESISSEETPYFTDLTVTRDPAWNTRRFH